MLLWSNLNAQSIQECKFRFDNYLNFKGSLNQVIKFQNDCIVIQAPNFLVKLYAHELPTIGRYLQAISVTQQITFLKWKGQKKLIKFQLDSLQKQFISKQNNSQIGLKGLRIAIEPGHFCANMANAHIEQKYLLFKPVAMDSVKLFESELTYLTAELLKKKLEDQGAIVFLTRNGKNLTSTGYDYNNLAGNKRKYWLDSLVKLGIITPQKSIALLKLSPTAFYSDFFKDFELSNRAKLINEFKPHATIIIHYNVDEKNVPWKKHTEKNYTMAFLPGAMTKGDLAKSESFAAFVRLLISNDLDNSAKLSSATVNALSQSLKIPIAKPQDAKYLNENCVITPNNGVYARNLALCRKINGPLVYGEALYQDNAKESYLLMKRDTVINGWSTNKRLFMVSESYYTALCHYFGIH